MTTRERQSVLRNKIKRSLLQGPRTIRQIAADFNLSITSLDVVLRDLHARGEVEREPIPPAERAFRGNCRFEWRLPA